MAESLSLPPNPYLQHTLAMCAPGQYLRGLRLTHDSDIRSITHIRCQKPDTAYVSAVAINGTLGDIGTATGATTDEGGCAPNEFWRGFGAWRSNDTHGIQAGCSAPN